ncbi:alpha/beta hydrolase, epoxide hydrolase-like protein [Pseudohyphozyma bogoriensis]|nr:alpha/beta hydrolase, epoxide hydrolase-like protein [Pseudohyphozyma bogoriensis]
MSAALAAVDVDTVKSVFSSDTRVRRGFCEVATSPKRPVARHNLYWELHGTDDLKATRLLFVMGLNNSSFGWWKQVKYFGSKPGYSVLVFDNRGVGSSDSPKGRYSTKEMAQDTVELLDFIGWKEKRSLNVVGVSMGGMIIQELALVIPERISSLNLVSTKAGDKFELPTSTSVGLFARLMTGTAGTPEQIVRLVVNSLFPPSYLDAEDPENPGQNRRVAVEKDFLGRSQITKLQTLTGKIGQMAAVMGHHMSPASMATISSTIPKVAIIVGDQDYLINYHNSLSMHKTLPGSSLKVVEGGGHALPSQIAEEFHEWIEGNVKEGKRLAEEAAGTEA